MFKKLFHKIFPCKNDREICKKNKLGCICGNWGSSKKKTSSQISAAGAMTPSESEQYQRSFEIGKLLEQIYKAQMGVGGYPSGYIPPEEAFRRSGDIASTLYGQTLTEARDPYAYYESTLQPQLRLAEDYINTKMQQRGLLKSGLTVEQMGRAGAELAIAEANARMQARANALQRAAGLTEYTRGEENKNLANLAQLYGQQQSIAQPQRQQQAQYAAYGPRAELGSTYGKEAALWSIPAALISGGAQLASAYATGKAMPPIIPTPTSGGGGEMTRLGMSQRELEDLMYTTRRGR